MYINVSSRLNCPSKGSGGREVGDGPNLLTFYLIERDHVRFRKQEEVGDGPNLLTFYLIERDHVRFRKQEFAGVYDVAGSFSISNKLTS